MLDTGLQLCMVGSPLRAFDGLVGDFAPPQPDHTTKLEDVQLAFV